MTQVVNIIDAFAGDPDRGWAGKQPDLPAGGVILGESLLANKGDPGIVGGKLLNRNTQFMYAAYRSETYTSLVRVEARVVFRSVTPAGATGTGFGMHQWCHRDKSGKIAAHLSFDQAGRSFTAADVGSFRALSAFAVNPKGTYPQLPLNTELNFSYTQSGNQITVTLPSGATIIASDPAVTGVGWSEADHTPETRYYVFETPNSECYFTRVAVYGATIPGGGGVVVGDTTAPTVPTGLTATAVSANQIEVDWNASTDAVGVASYKLRRDGVLIATVSHPTTIYQDTGRKASTPYSYTVAALDAAGNASAVSSSVSATTDAAIVVGGGIRIGWGVLIGNAGSNAAPTASFTTSQPSSKFVVTDGNASLDPDGFIATYRWDFGDGSAPVISDAEVGHVYAATGTYTITLTVTDNQGAKDTISKQVAVT